MLKSRLYIIFLIINISEAFIGNLRCQYKFYDTVKFSMTFNKNFAEAAMNLSNLNEILNSKEKQINLNRFNFNDKLTIGYSYEIPFGDKKLSNRCNILLKNKHNYYIEYALPYDNYNFKYLICIKATPIEYEKTEWNVRVKYNIQYCNESYIKELIKSSLLEDINRPIDNKNIELVKFFIK